ncbi:MAG: dehydrogenase [Candidatus Binatia bacterium]|nr:MAG: dehydrogenase [Candidatus Binatia bacterium]
MENRPVVVVGSGPAGAATALFLHRRCPELARSCVVLEKAFHPREKVCAGGLIPRTLAFLAELGVPLDVPHASVRRARVDTPLGPVDYEDGDLCRVVRRAEFDALLVAACRERGIEVREGVHVRRVLRESGGFRVETDRGSYRTRVVVGADGSGSVVRRSLFPGSPGALGRAVMADVPLAGLDWDGFEKERYEFDFSGVATGLRGYAWTFPCLVRGEPHANVGVYSCDIRERRLERALRERVRRLCGKDLPWKAFPVRGTSPPLRAPGVLLVGDAAGVDPLLGEGISCAFEYGRLAAESLERAFRTGEFGFEEYGDRVRLGPLGRKLRRLSRATSLLYGRSWKVWFAFLRRSRRAQDVAVRWYNGVDGLDDEPLWKLFARVAGILPAGGEAGRGGS